MSIIPLHALQQHIAVLGKTGSGKTFAAKAAIVEPLLAAGQRVGVIDPTGAWWGLRTSRNGSEAGFPVVVLGGDHGDLPLPPLGGAAVARLLVEQRVNLVADTSQLTVGESARWFIDFAGTLYRLNKSPLHLVIDEAHNFAPQGKVPDPDTGKMLHAANRLASGGRSRGIRLTMITQRPQKLHKDTLTSADTLIAMRVLAPQDRHAVEEWVRGCGDTAQGAQVLNSLASLQRGEGWVWYPEGSHLKRVKFPQIVTFDSSATPTDGHEVATPKGVADIDLSEIRRAMSEAVAMAEATDPKLLRAKIQQLERQIAQRAPPPVPVVIDEAYKNGRRDGYERAKREMAGFLAPLEATCAQLQAIADGLRLNVMGANTAPVRDPAPSPAVRTPEQRPAQPQTGQLAPMAKAERLALTALAQYPQGRSIKQVALLSGYASGGGGFRNALGALRSRGYIEGSKERLQATPAGLAALGPFDPLPTGQALREHWYAQLSKAERKALQALVEAHPNTLTVAQIANRSGYEAGGGGFRNALGRLRTLDLIHGRAEIRASEDLF